MMVIDLARNWWAFVLRGVFAVIFGILAFAWPGITLQALVLLYGAYALVDGVFALASVIVGRTEAVPWWALLLEGIAGIAVAIMTVAWPGITALVLLYMIAAWSLVTGGFEIAAAIRLRKQIRNEWLLAASGILSILFGVALVVNPVAVALAVVWLIGAYAITFGILMIALGLRLRKWARERSVTSAPTSKPAAATATGPANSASAR
jgi:uncharacterized membrane protein HdeD (DUF308 family)